MPPSRRLWRTLLLCCLPVLPALPGVFVATWRLPYPVLLLLLAGSVAAACAFARALHKAGVRQESRQAGQDWTRAVVDAAPLPLLVSQLDDGTIRYANARARQLLGDVDGQPLHALLADGAARARVGSLTSPGKDGERELVGAKGRCFPALVSTSLLRDAHGPRVLTGLFDIGDRKRLEERVLAGQAALRRELAEVERLRAQLAEQAVRDGLTGVFNRRYLDGFLPGALALARREGGVLSVLLIDADHFKKINDGYGHASGDRVLKAIGAELSAMFRDSDMVCRYGGEEFVVVLHDADAPSAELRAGRLRRQLAALALAAEDGRPLRFTVSVGVAAFPLHGTNAQALLNAADAALYRAKADGRDRVCVAALPA
ncbi:GGDEF domain-containing protein [Crenobacter intestini]|uniref:diguanylate cyclase n=1 Tax=Crenobacter intestini TaxID=2563443 RepID=A0A4T0V336_9NEIS|nr:GGDEF domain-containing protein [Crenobacter intestini]TIC86032.1 diguanylate cyclase [Crenobacter intestini]